MNYELYHDESMEPGYWHGLLFVPVDRRDDVIGFLKSIRREAGYAESEALNFKNLDGQGKKFKGIWFSLQLLHLLLRRVIKSDDTSAVRKKTPEYHADVGLRADYQEVLQVQEVCDVKFVLLKERDAHGTMNAYPDHASKIETTFRFALKGGCHFLFAEDRPITVKKIFFDGHEHYGRSIDKARVLRNLNAEFRPFCTIAPDFEIDERQLRDRDDDSFIMMNFIDNIVSAWRCLISQTHSNPAQAEVVQTLRGLLERWESGKIHKNPNGRWFRSFSLSECWLENGEWNFDSLQTKSTVYQQKLFI